MADDADRGLVDAALNGDRAAMANLLRRHYDRVHAVAWRLTGSRSDADDIAQEVSCAVVERIDAFRGEAKFSTWLMGIAVNACRDHQRRRRSLSRLRDGVLTLVGLAQGPDGRDLYRQSWLASEVAKLDPRVREAVVLIVGEDLTHAEAACALGVAESTVSWWMHEARRRLNPRMQKDGAHGL